MKLKDKKPIIIAALRSLGITPRELEITHDAGNTNRQRIRQRRVFSECSDYIKATFGDLGGSYEQKRNPGQNVEGVAQGETVYPAWLAEKIGLQKSAVSF